MGLVQEVGGANDRAGAVEDIAEVAPLEQPRQLLLGQELPCPLGGFHLVLALVPEEPRVAEALPFRVLAAYEVDQLIDYSIWGHRWGSHDPSLLRCWKAVMFLSRAAAVADHTRLLVRL